MLLRDMKRILKRFPKPRKDLVSSIKVSQENTGKGSWTSWKRRALGLTYPERKAYITTSILLAKAK